MMGRDTCMARVRVTSICREGREQLGHPVPAVAPLVVEQYPAGVGDGYDSGPPVSGSSTRVTRLCRSNR